MAESYLEAVGAVESYLEATGAAESADVGPRVRGFLRRRAPVALASLLSFFPVAAPAVNDAAGVAGVVPLLLILTDRGSAGSGLSGRAIWVTRGPR